MAYDFTAASSQYLSIGSTPVTAEPFTISCIARPATTNQTTVMVAIESGVNHRYALSLISGVVSVQSIANNNNTVSVGSALSANTDYHCAGVWAASNSRVAFLDGTPGTPGTVNVVPVGISLIKVAARTSSSTVGAFFNGRLSNVGIWNIDLSGEEISALAKGMSCEKIRPQNLVFHAPLVRDLQDARGGLTITNNNAATVATHPRIYA